MDIDKNELDGRYLSAKKRVEKLRKYYSHLTIYIVVNSLLSIYKIVKDINRGDSFEEAIFEGNNVSLWFWWGIFIVFHTYNIFSENLLFMNKDWEDKPFTEKDYFSKSKVIVRSGLIDLSTLFKCYREIQLQHNYHGRFIERYDFDGTYIVIQVGS